MSLERDWAQNGSTSDGPVVCGFLTLSSKEFTIGVQVVEGMFIKAGDRETMDKLKIEGERAYVVPYFGSLQML